METILAITMDTTSPIHVLVQLEDNHERSKNAPGDTSEKLK